MRLPDFLHFTPDERRAALALLLFTGGGSLVLEVGKRHPEWMPDLLTVRGAVIPGNGARPGGAPADSGVLTAGMLSGGAGGTMKVPPDASGTPHESRPKAPAAPVDVNAADRDLLCTLPGIGPALAARIIEDRSRNGPFRTIDDLRRVKGIGPATLLRLKPHIVLQVP